MPTIGRDGMTLVATLDREFGLSPQPPRAPGPATSLSPPLLTSLPLSSPEPSEQPLELRPRPELGAAHRHTIRCA